MHIWFYHLRQLHRFLAGQALYLVLLSTLLAVSLFAGRAYLMVKLDDGKAIHSEASSQPHWEELKETNKSGSPRVFVSSWIDEYERSFVQLFIEFSVRHTFGLRWQEFTKLARLGVLNLQLGSWAVGPQRPLVRFLAELSIGPALTYAFLLWNLFLAWIPYLSSLWAAYIHQLHPGRWWCLLVPGGLWLIFFPNAPYILTDFLHLRTRAPIPIWYDVGMLTFFAWTGLFLAVFSLRTMQSLVRSYLGSVASWLFVFVTLGLGGLGIYIGRFLRWNSWDLLLHPRGVLTDIAIRLSNPWRHPGTWGVTLLFAAFLLICYLTLSTIPSREQA